MNPGTPNTPWLPCSKAADEAQTIENIGSNTGSNIGSNTGSNIGSNIGGNVRSNIRSNIGNVGRFYCTGGHYITERQNGKDTCMLNRLCTMEHGRK
jgi:hypothetical protein